MSEKKSKIQELKDRVNASKPAAVVQSPRRLPDPVPAVPPPDKPPKKPGKAKTQKEYVQAACGHRIGTRAIEQKKCEQCRAKDRRGRNAKVEARRQGEKLTRMSPAGKGRLPDGSVFHLSYDSKKEIWVGVLNVPGLELIGGSASGVFALMTRLDQTYRESLEKSEVPVTQPDPDQGDVTAAPPELGGEG